MIPLVAMTSHKTVTHKRLGSVSTGKRLFHFGTKVMSSSSAKSVSPRIIKEHYSQQDKVPSGLETDSIIDAFLVHLNFSETRNRIS